VAWLQENFPAKLKHHPYDIANEVPFSFVKALPATTYTYWQTIFIELITFPNSSSINLNLGLESCFSNPFLRPGKYFLLFSVARETS